MNLYILFIVRSVWKISVMTAALLLAIVLVYSVQPLVKSHNVSWDDMYEYEPSSIPGSNYCNSRLNVTNQHVLAYSVYGAFAKRYASHLDPMVKAVKQNPIYDGWRIRFYHDQDLPLMIQEDLEEKYSSVDFCNIKKIPQLGDLSNIHQLMWRFLVIGDPSVDVFVSRDIETFASQREAIAVQQWLDSDKILHVMRDHPRHDVSIKGGMWGFKNHLNRQLGIRFLNAFLHAGVRDPRTNDWKQHEKILQRWVWSALRDSAFVHDSFSCYQHESDTKPWPIKRNSNGSYVGCEEFHQQSCDVIVECPKKCRPKEHTDWKYC